MPLKTILKLLWGTNFFFFLAAIGVFVWIFFVQSKNPITVKNINIEPLPKILNTNNLPLESYKDTYSSRFLVDAPVFQPPTLIPRPQQDYHKELLQRKVKITQIVRVGFALISVNNQEPTLLEALTEKNKKNNSRPWEISVDGNKIIAMEIVPGKGIRFRFSNGGREIWMDHKESNLPSPKTTNKGSSNDSGSTSDFKIREVEPNHWEVSATEGTAMLQNADKHVESIAPSLEYDDEGQAIGVRLKGEIDQASPAYQYGLRKNDLVKSINGMPTNNLDPAYLERLARTNKNSKTVEVEIMRDGQPIKLRFDVVR